MTTALGELGWPSLASPNTQLPASLTRRIHDWQAHKTRWFAGDLVGAALVLGRPEAAVDAAQFILAQDSEASPGAKAAARRILEPGGEEINVDDVQEENMERAYKSIRSLRLRLKDEPRNSVVWIDLAREYTIQGHLYQAERAVRIAANLSPTNRFVLRCAARFFVHVGDVRQAHGLLRAVPATLTDPWLAAAEIAVASAANIPARFARTGQRLLLDASYSPFHLSELASALGTLELEHGKNRIARRLFNRSLLSPTENAVAQAQWASKGKLPLDIDIGGSEAPRVYEAKAWEYFGRGLWEEALEGSHNWLLDEPFSNKPAALGSYIATTVLEDYKRAEEILNTGLVANPHDALLRNNLAFIYASLDRPDDAGQQIALIHPGELNVTDSISLLATRGLIFFRRGLAHKGRELYREAMEKAAMHSLPVYRARAAIYLAREEILAKSPYAMDVFEEAMTESKRISEPEFEVMRRRLAGMAPWEIRKSSGLKSE